MSRTTTAICVIFIGVGGATIWPPLLLVMIFLLLLPESDRYGHRDRHHHDGDNHQQAPEHHSVAGERREVGLPGHHDAGRRGDHRRSNSPTVTWPGMGRAGPAGPGRGTPVTPGGDDADIRPPGEGLATLRVPRRAVGRPEIQSACREIIK